MTRPTPADAPVQRIPLAEIDDEALPRDRTGLEPEPLTELRSSILASGLRMPVELYPLERPGELRWGIVSGFRRIAVFRELHAWEMPGYDTIPAFVRERATVPDTFAAMVEENEIRADLSPWEKGRIATQAWRFHVFPTIDAAVDRLYPAADKVKRARLRAIAHLAESFDGLLKQPEKLSQRQAMRMHAACANGFIGVIQTALEEGPKVSHEQQWALIEPILRESELGTNEAPDFHHERPNRGRPRRVVHIQTRRIVIRRERTPEGFLLRFTGKDASSLLLDEVLDEIERMFAPA